MAKAKAKPKPFRGAVPSTVELSKYEKGAVVACLTHVRDRGIGADGIFNENADAALKKLRAAGW